jgi:hypothetical protein
MMAVPREGSCTRLTLGQGFLARSGTSTCTWFRSGSSSGSIASYSNHALSFWSSGVSELVLAGACTVSCVGDTAAAIVVRRGS